MLDKWKVLVTGFWLEKGFEGSGGDECTTSELVGIRACV